MLELIDKHLDIFQVLLKCPDCITWLCLGCSFTWNSHRPEEVWMCNQIKTVLSIFFFPWGLIVRNFKNKQAAGRRTSGHTHSFSFIGCTYCKFSVFAVGYLPVVCFVCPCGGLHAYRRDRVFERRHVGCVLLSHLCVLFVFTSSYPSQCVTQVESESGSVPRHLSACGSTTDYFCAPRHCLPAEK